MTAYFIVRAQITDDADKDAFDRWYQEEHLPDAHKAFNARRAWRGWSELDGTVHFAAYEFDDVATARALLDSDALKRMSVEFSRAWGDRVTRSREILDIAQTIGG